MKNIHLIPTNKPSRLIHNDSNQLCYQSNKSFKNDRKNRKKFNIYITNDEEVKEGDWVLSGNKIYQIKESAKDFLNHVQSISRKIILTTDQDLIKDGVQAIDDKFIEWFVKNPTCEEVEVRYEVLKPFQSIDKGYILRLPDTDVLEKPKQETLEEFALRSSKYKNHTNINNEKYEAIILGAKWMQERMYSEEDMRKAFIAGGNSQIEEDDDYGTEYDAYMEKWFNQFKKK